MPSSANYTYRFSSPHSPLQIYEEFGTKYRRLPGSARFKNLDPEIDIKAQVNPTSAALAKHWTAPLYVSEEYYNYYKAKLQAKQINKFPLPMSDKKSFWIYLAFEAYTGEYLRTLDDPLWSYAGHPYFEIPFSSSLESATVDLVRIESIEGIDFDLTTSVGNTGTINRPLNVDTTAGQGIMQQYGGVDSTERNTASSSIGTEERRASNNGRLLKSMTSTGTSTSTTTLPTTVFVSVEGQGSGGASSVIPVTLPPQTRSNQNITIRQAIVKALQGKGFTQSAIQAFFKENPRPQLLTLPTGFGNKDGSGSNGNRGGGNKGSGNTVDFGITPQPEVNSQIIVRFGRSYSLPKDINKEIETRPMMIQWVTNSPVRTATDFQNGKSILEEDRIIYDEATNRLIKWSTQQATLKYVFPYIPTDIQYSSLGAQWTEVPRAQNIPFVDFQGFQRMKVSFSFIIASTRKDGDVEVPDGLYTSVDEQITLLRKMYQAKQPVTIYNMDGLLSNSADRLNNNPVQFVIADLGIEAIRRQGSSPSHITTAQCSITLNEVLVESAVLINIAPPQFDEFVPTGKPGPGGTTPQRPDLWTKYLPQPVTQIFTNDSQLTIGRP